MSGLTQDGTAEPVSRDQILRRDRGQGNIDLPCSADPTGRIGNFTRLIHTLAICVTTHIHTYFTITGEKPTVILELLHYQSPCAPSSEKTLQPLIPPKRFDIFPP